MNIKLPKINKIELDKVVKYTSLKKLSFVCTMNIECFDCGYDCDCGWDCQDCDCDCDYNPYGYDCIDDYDCDCDCVCDYDCDCNLWDYDYILRKKTTPPTKSSNNDDGIHIIGVRFVTQTRGCYYYRCKKPEYKIGDTLSVPTQYGSKEARVVFVRTYKDTNEYSKDNTYSLDGLKWAPEKKTLSQEEFKKIEQERLAKEKAEKERQERVRKEEEEKKQIIEEKNKLRNDLTSLNNKYKKEDYNSINFHTITNLISTFEKKLESEKYLTYKQDYKILMLALSKVKTLEQDEVDRKRKKIITIFISTIAAIVLLLVFTNNVIVPSVNYSNAVNLIKNGKYDKAEDIFYELGDYKDSKTYIKLINLKEQCDRKEYTKAISTIESIGGSSKFDIDYNGGTKSNSYINLYGKRINTSEKTGYTFKEYLTSSYLLDVKNKQLTIKVKATYTINQYSITYYLDGGSLSKNNPTGYSVDTNTFVLNEPTKTGYEFLGWIYSENSIPEKNVEIAKGTTGDLTFTANWNANIYSVSFDSNGGNSFSDLSVTYDSNYSLPTPTKTGYTFSGWYSENNLVFSNGTWKYSTNLNLVAKWSLNSYSITYYLNGGKADNPSSYNVNTSTFSLNDPEKIGYKFAGWSTSTNGTKYMNITIEKGCTGSKTYYANWEVIPYNISYHLDSGKNNVNNPTNYTVEDMFHLKDATKEGYTFEGWYNDSNYQTKVTTINKGTIGTLSLYAKFTATIYQIIVNASSFSVVFMLNDGTNSVYSTQLVSTTSSLKYPSIPTRDGYIFTGWYLDESCTKLYDFAKPIYLDIKLYAGWMQCSYEVKYVINSFSIVLGGSFVFSCLTDGEIKFTLGDNSSSYYRTVTVKNLTKNTTIFSGKYNRSDLPVSYNTYVDAGDVIFVTSSSLFQTSSITMTIKGITLPQDEGKAVNTYQNKKVSYGSAYKLLVRSVEGYKFIGYFDSDGNQYTDEYGNSIFDYNVVGDLILFEKWEKV